MIKSITLTVTEKASLISNIASINKLIIILTKQIMVVQHELSILIGAPYSATFLAVEKIDLVIVKLRVISQLSNPCEVYQLQRGP